MCMKFCEAYVRHILVLSKLGMEVRGLMGLESIETIHLIKNVQEEEQEKRHKKI